MNGIHATAIAEKVMFEELEATQPAFNDVVLPPTRAHVEYWRKLCRAFSLEFAANSLRISSPLRRIRVEFHRY